MHVRRRTHSTVPRRTPTSPTAHAYVQWDTDRAVRVPNRAYVRVTGRRVPRLRRIQRMHTHDGTPCHVPVSHTAHTYARRDTRMRFSVTHRARIRGAGHRARTFGTPSAHGYARRDASNTASVTYRARIRGAGRQPGRRRRIPRTGALRRMRPAPPQLALPPQPASPYRLSSRRLRRRLARGRRSPG